MTDSIVDAGTVTGLSEVASDPSIEGISIAGSQAHLARNTITAGTYVTAAESVAGVAALLLYNGSVVVRNNELVGISAPGSTLQTTGLVANGYANDLRGTSDGNLIRSGTTLGQSTGLSLVDANFLIVNNFILCEPGGNESTGVTIHGRYQTILQNNTIHAGSPADLSTGVYFGDYNWMTEIELPVVNNIVDAGAGGLEIRGIRVNPGNRNLHVWNNDILGASKLCPIWDYPTESCVGTIDDVNVCNWGGCVEAGDNISEDPIYAGDGDLHIMGGACVNAGIDPSSHGSLDDASHDIDGDPRPLGMEWDIGADEQM